MSIAGSLKASGVADVIVVLAQATAPPLPRAAGAAVSAGAAAEAELSSSVLRHFSASPLSQDAALLEALNARGAVFSARGAAGGTSGTHVSAAAVPESTVRYYPNLGVALGTVDRAGLAALRREDEVEQVVDAPQLRLIRPVASAAADVQPGYTWGLRALGVDRLHAMGLSGKGVLIGHLDTGVDASHPALAGVVKAFAEFDALGSPVPGAKPKDSGRHGTHTAGTIAGQMVGGVHFGVAPGAGLASAMVIEGGNLLARILGGMDWAVGQGIRILSMSLGLSGYDEAFLPLTQILRARGVLPVYAVGNEGAERAATPATTSRRFPWAPSAAPARWPTSAAASASGAGRTRSFPTSSRRAKASCRACRAAPTCSCPERRWRRRTSPGWRRC